MLLEALNNYRPHKYVPNPDRIFMAILQTPGNNATKVESPDFNTDYVQVSESLKWNFLFNSFI